MANNNCTDENRHQLWAARQMFKMVAPLLCGVGIVSNILNMIVLTRLRVQSSTNMYLFALAVCDFCFSIIILVLCIRLFDHYELNWKYMICLPYLYAIGNFQLHTAAWLTCAFTIERYLAISSPMLSRKICTRKRSKCIIAGIVCFTTLFTMPDPFLREIVKEGSTTCTNGEYNLRGTNLHKRLKNAGWLFIVIGVTDGIPFVILAIFNGLLIQSIWKASKSHALLGKYSFAGQGIVNTLNEGEGSSNLSRNTSLTTAYNKTQSTEEYNEKNHTLCSYPCTKNEGGTRQIKKEPTSKVQPTGKYYRHCGSKRSRESSRITTMLIVVVLTYLTLKAPSSILILMGEANFGNTTGKRERELQTAGNYANLALLINSALNFFLYSWFSNQFRRTFFALFRNYRLLKIR